jgi:hypothetical protein
VTIAEPTLIAEAAPAQRLQANPAPGAPRQSDAPKPAQMKALVYHGPGQKAWEDHPKPELSAPTDAIVKVTKTTICGTRPAYPQR